MIRTFLLTIFAALALGMSAQVKDYELKINDFNELTVVDDVNVTYVKDAQRAGYAVYSCDKKCASALTFTNNKGKMKIEVISDEPINEKLPTITVYSSDLKKVSNLGDSTICVTAISDIESLALKVIGNGSIQASEVECKNLSAAVEAGSGRVFIAGKAKDAKYTLASTGAIEAGGLVAQKVKCWTFGTGSIDCHAVEHLSVYGATSGTIYYIGDPSIKKRCVGVKLVKVEE